MFEGQIKGQRNWSRVRGKRVGSESVRLAEARFHMFWIPRFQVWILSLKVA